MLLEIFIIQKGTSFLLVRRTFTKKEIQLEGNLFSGMISAISLFTTELKMGEIQFFETKENRIMIHPFEDIIAVGIVEGKKGDTFAEQTLRKIALKFWDVYSDVFLQWNGDINLFSQFPEMIDEITYTEFSNYYIAENFPQNLISVIRGIQGKFEPHVIQFIGKSVGVSRAELLARTSPKLAKKNFTRGLIKELNSFSICSISTQDDREWLIEMKISPFSRGIANQEFSCDFIIGFIHGFVNQVESEKKFMVYETNCAARGDKNCIFKIELINFRISKRIWVEHADS
ncbi:MAG: V4R domain-containing protein [Promethearchaeota archaeon]